MKRIQVLSLGLILLLAACTSTSTESTVSEPVLPAAAPKEMDGVDTVNEAETLPETAVNETANKPQFIMFTASW